MVEHCDLLTYFPSNSLLGHHCVLTAYITTLPKNNIFSKKCVRFVPFPKICAVVFLKLQETQQLEDHTGLTICDS